MPKNKTEVTVKITLNDDTAVSWRDITKIGLSEIVRCIEADPNAGKIEIQKIKLVTDPAKQTEPVAA